MPNYGVEVLGPPARPHDQEHWDPEALTMDPEQRREVQLGRLKDLVGKTLAHDGDHLFKRKLADGGIGSADDIKTLEDINQIPTTLKQDLRDSEADHPPMGDYRYTALSDCVRIGQSTGTTGTPTLTALTRHDLWVEYESGARNWWRSGWRPGQVVTHCHPAYMYGGGALLSGSLEYFGFLNLWVAPPDTDEIAELGIRTWQRIRPDISMVALSMHRFVEVAAKLGIDLKEDCGFPDFQMGGFGRGLMPLMTAGFECYAYLAGPDKTCDGAHINEDWAIVQAIDPDSGRDVADGQWGNMVITTLDRDNGLLRYDLEEAAMIEPSTCPRGETGRIGYWGGRFKDFLSSQGIHFQLMDVERAIAGVGELAKPTLEFVIVNPKGSPDPLQVRVELGGEQTPSDSLKAEVASKVREAIHGAVGLDSTVDVLDRETLPRSGYKLKRVVDE